MRREWVVAAIAVLVALAGVALSDSEAVEAMTICPGECWSAGCGSTLDPVNWGAGYDEVQGGMICKYEDVYGNTWDMLVVE